MFVVLNAVIQQVDDDLPDMGGAADHVRSGGIRQAVVLHRDAAVGCAELAQHEYIVAKFFKVERHMLERYLAVLDFAHLEDVVNEREQVVGGHACFGAAFASDLYIALFQFLNLNKAQDAVERCADVVAHTREERGLGGVGSIGFLPLFPRALKRPDKDGDAGQQNADDNGGNDGAVAIEESKCIGFLSRIRCGGITVRGERFAGIDDALINDS